MLSINESFPLQIFVRYDYYISFTIFINVSNFCFHWKWKGLVFLNIFSYKIKLSFKFVRQFLYDKMMKVVSFMYFFSCNSRCSFVNCIAFFHLKLIISIACSLKYSQNFIQFSSLYTLCLFSWYHQRALQHHKNCCFHVLFYEI